MGKGTYYDEIAAGYDELHESEQLKKLAIIKKELKITKGAKLLDVGCGSGISSDFGCDVTGIDPSAELIKIAKKRFAKDKNKTFMQASAENLPFPDHTFDIVVSLTAMQNFYDIEKGVKEMKRVGKETFALSYLKKSPKAKQIESVMKKEFPNARRIEEEKDIIFIIK